jgi:hypothetical protein
MTAGALFATTPDNKSVMRYGGGTWTQVQSAYSPYTRFVGMPTGYDHSIYAGTAHGLYRADSFAQNVLHYEPYGGHNHWS